MITWIRHFRKQVTKSQSSEQLLSLEKTHDITPLGQATALTLNYFNGSKGDGGEAGAVWWN